MDITIYHNPRCSKSRQTLQILADRGHSPDIVEYLERPPNAATLKSLLRALNLSPRELMRTKEAAYNELDLGNARHSEDDLIDAMISHPILIERPIVVIGDKATIGRPPENVIALLDS